MAVVDVPKPDDVVIQADRIDASSPYVLRSRDGPDQFVCATRAEAERRARSHAKHARVNVWLARAPDERTVLGRFRRVSVRATARDPSR